MESNCVQAPTAAGNVAKLLNDSYCQESNDETLVAQWTNVDSFHIDPIGNLFGQRRQPIVW